MSKCSACDGSLSAKDKIKCSMKQCDQQYHLQCVGLLSSKIEGKSAWVCPRCKSKERRIGDNSETPVRLNPTTSKDSNGSSEVSFVTLRPQKPICDAQFLASICDDVMLSIRKELPNIIGATLDKKLNELSTKVQSMEDSIKLMSNCHDDLTKSSSNQLLTIKKLQNENKLLKDDIKSLEERLSSMELASAKQEQWGKLQNVEIVGIPENDSESLPAVIVQLAALAGLKIQSEDLEFVHRIRAKRPIAGKPRSIVARFRERNIKDVFISYLRKKRSITGTDIGLTSDLKIYVNEHLTLQNKLLLSKCKAKAKESQYKYVWTKNCRIYVRKNDTAPYILISTEMDLKKLI